MAKLDIIIVGYRSEAFLPRLTEDIETMTMYDHAVYYWDNTGNPKTLSAAWNDLAVQGKAEYLAVLNPDIALSPEWDERLIVALRTNSEVGIATADPAPFSLSAPTHLQMSEISCERRGGLSLSENQVQFFAAFMERSLWEGLKGVDERMRFYMQDIDFIVRASERFGKGARRVFSCPIWHAGSASTREAASRNEIDPQMECDLGSWVFNEVRQKRIPAWDLLSVAERAQIRSFPMFAGIERPGKA